MQAHLDGKDIEFRYPSADGWAIASTPSWDWHRNDYRVKPEPKTVALTPDDINALTWIMGPFGNAQMVVEITPDGVYTRDSFVSFEIMADRYRMSSDMVNWLPCTKTIN